MEKEWISKFNIYDGYGIIIAHECGIGIVVLSGRKSACTESRCADLGIDRVFTGIKNKHDKLIEIAKELKLDLTEIAYIGDDVIDLKAMSLVGFKAAPANAMSFVKTKVDYITQNSGGNGALRELVELVLHCQNRFDECFQKYL